MDGVYSQPASIDDSEQLHKGTDGFTKFLNGDWSGGNGCQLSEEILNFLVDESNENPLPLSVDNDFGDNLGVGIGPGDDLGVGIGHGDDLGVGIGHGDNGGIGSCHLILNIVIGESKHVLFHLTILIFLSVGVINFIT